MAAFISCSTGGGNDAAEKAAEQMADFFGPAQVAEFIRQAVKMCWMAPSPDLPDTPVGRQLRWFLDHQGAELLHVRYDRRTRMGLHRAVERQNLAAHHG